MKNPFHTPIIKLTERFDKELLNILSKDLDALRSEKNNKIKTVLDKQKLRLLVA